MDFLNKSLQGLKDCISDELLSVEQFMLKKISTTDPFVFEVFSYLMSSGGKRIRAVLVIAFSKIMSLPIDSMSFITASLELVHNATLLHDDVIDESVSRRGSRSVNDLWGNKGSILVGDALLALSFRFATETQNMKFLSSLAELSEQLVLGEIMELRQVANDISNQERYFELINLKTASLFGLACSSSSIISNNSHAELTMSFGRNFGIAYQIIDDVFDYKGSISMLGKKSGTDFLTRKITLPIILLYKLVPEEEKARIRLWAEGGDSISFEEILVLMDKFGSCQLSIDVAHDCTRKAIDSLDGFCCDSILLDKIKLLCESFFFISLPE